MPESESRFQQQPNTDAQQAAYRAEEARRLQNRNVGMDPFNVCIRCGYKVRESSRRAMGMTACPRCHGHECRIENLDYDQSIPANPIPTYEQALADERNIQTKRQQIIGGP